MKIFKPLLFCFALAIAIKAWALPTIDQEQLKAAAYAENKSQQLEAYKNNSFAPTVEKFCLSLAKVRLGNAYRLEVTDRRVPKLGQINGSYTIVGNGEGTPTLSFLCKISVDDNKKMSLSEFKLYEVIRQEKNEVNK